jgi:filamentous hemagglutinin
VDDVIAAKADDSLVLENTPVKQAVQVYNFSVNKTASYFVGESGLWAHNAKCELIPGGSLSAHEGVGKGHTLEKHVNVTTSDLADRANGRGAYAGQKLPPMSSRYKDRATAEFVIGETITDNKNAIEAWLNDVTKKNTQSFESINHYDVAIGEGVSIGSEVAQALNKARVVLKKEPSVPEGYIILTSSPI